MSFRLSAENLGKWYEIRPQSGFSSTWYQTLAACSKRVGLRLPSYRAGDGIWALKDVSFQVAQGEVLGVIGPNGAGKTTLLRLLSKVTPPTKGRVSGRGRVVSLLELGMGFQPDLPGLENIYLNAAMHDISRAEVERCLDAIIAFSELERFIHTPVKHYSSGMYLRLAFAIATNLEAEILLADEVLAVGDISFQERCIKRVRESAEAGTSVLFVSHDMAAIRRLCNRVLWLDRGEVVALGDTEEVVSRYERGALGIERTAKAGSERTRGKAGGETDERSNKWVDYIGTELVSETGEPIGALLNTQPVRIRFALNIKIEGVPIRCAVVLTTETHPPIHLLRIVQPVDAMPQGGGLCHVTATIPGHILNAGSFTAKCAVSVEANGELHVLSRDRGLRFSVMRPLETSPTEDRLAGLPDTGVMAPPVTWVCVRPDLPVKEGSQ